MTAVVDDPLIAGMVIRRVLPLHESSRRLRRLYPECPRVYGVAVMSDVSKRRWWPLEAALTSGRLDAMFADAAEEMDSPAAAAQQLAATLAHTVIGRVVALVVLEGRAWDTGLENLWVHVDSEGAIDWLGVVDPTLRVLPDDPCVGAGAGGRGGGTARRGGARHLAGAPVPPRAGTAVRPICTRPAAARSAWRRCGTPWVLPSSWRPPRYLSWPARARSSACAAGRRCSTRSSDSGCRCAASSTRADGAGIQFGRITGKGLRN